MHLQLGPYIFCIFIILAADQNTFKLMLYNGLKVHTLIFNLRVCSSQLVQRLMNYSSLICSSPLYQGTISIWTTDSKAISWTVGCFLIISTSVKQVKGLEVTLSVPFAFELLMWTHIMCSKELSIQEKQTIVRLQKQNIHQRDTRNIRSGQISSLVQ